MKVLIVDDSGTMRKIIKKTIMSTGSVDEIVEAEDGLDAVRKLQADPNVNLILLDINMPNIDGITTLKEIKKVNVLKDIPVIMCTSEAEKATVVECIKLGAKDYIVKPFSKEIFAQKISSVL